MMSYSLQTQNMMAQQIQQDLEERYRIEEYIGSGSFASVWKAFDISQKVYVAIKKFHNELSPSFYKEAMAMMSLEYNHIVKVLNIFEKESYRYLILEYCDDFSLRQKIQKKVFYQNFRKIVSVIKQILLAVQVAHKYGLVHRDLKPENILFAKTVSGEMQVKVTDFGLARFFLPQRLCTTLTFGVSGSPHYMAPEQFIGEYNTASDIYALGIIFYELLMGRLPFEGCPEELAKQHLYKAPKWEYCSPSLQNILRKMLMKEKEDRPNAAMCLEFIDDLISNEPYIFSDNFRNKYEIPKLCERSFFSGNTKVWKHSDGFSFVIDHSFYCLQNDEVQLLDTNVAIFKDDMGRFICEKGAYIFIYENIADCIEKTKAIMLQIDGEYNWFGIAKNKILLSLENRLAEYSFDNTGKMQQQWDIEISDIILTPHGLYLEEDKIAFVVTSKNSRIYLIQNGLIKKTIVLMGICLEIAFWKKYNMLLLRVYEGRASKLVCIPQDHFSPCDLVNSAEITLMHLDNQRGILYGVNKKGSLLQWTSPQDVYELHTFGVNEKICAMHQHDQMFTFLLSHHKSQQYFIVEVECFDEK